MDTKSFVADKIRHIRDTIGGGKAISALSGGVDSSTCTVLAHRAIGESLKSVFIDDGLMREDEPRDVQKIFAGMGIPVNVVDAQDEFFAALRGKLDPEEKRKAFRNTFYTVFGREVRKSGARFLVQGTIAADIIETKGGVKTQHNILEQIGIDPEAGYGFRVVEPIKTCSSMRSARWRRRWGSRNRSISGCRFRGRAWRRGWLGRSRRKGWPRSERLPPSWSRRW